MTTVYKIFNPQTGQYLDAADFSECVNKLADVAWQHYLAYSHGSPYSICETDANGVQVWRNPQGEEILSPEEVLRISALKMSAQLSSIPPTPIEDMP